MEDKSLAVGMLIYHKTNKTRAKIIEFDSNSITLELEQEIANTKILNLPIGHMGIWLFFDSSHIELPLSELEMIPEYQQFFLESIVDIENGQREKEERHRKKQEQRMKKQEPLKKMELMKKQEQIKRLEHQREIREKQYLKDMIVLPFWIQEVLKKCTRNLNKEIFLLNLIEIGLSTSDETFLQELRNHYKNIKGSIAYWIDLKLTISRVLGWDLFEERERMDIPMKKISERTDGKYCYQCKGYLYSDYHKKCEKCNWLICPIDKACGCNYKSNLNLRSF